MNNLGNRLTAVRKAKHLTQLDLAQAVGLGNSGISAIEKNKAVNVETIKLIADYLQIDFNWLLNGKGEAPEGIIIEEKESPWKDATFSALQSEINFLREIVKNLTGKNAPTNFLKALKKSSSGNGILSAKAA